MRGRRVFCMILCVLMCAGLASPALSQSYGTELPFVLGTSARPSGMGVSGLSLMGDASIHYYNASALSGLQWKQFTFYKATLFESKASYHTLSYAHPLLDHGTVALSILRVSVGGVEERDETNQLLTDDLHNTQTRLLLGYGRDIGSSFAAGFNLVFDNQSFGSFSGSGVGLDVGISANQPISGHSMLKGLRGGIVVRNLLEPSVKLDEEKVSDPMELGLGLGLVSVLQSVNMVTAIDIINPRFSPVSLRVGQEFTYDGNYSLRLGVDRATPTFGLGAQYKNLNVDYAFRNEDFGSNHRFSLSVRFGPSLTEQRTQARLRREQEINETISVRMSDLEEAQISQSLEEGKQLFAQGDYEGALSRFEITLLWDPENDEAKTLATTCRYEQALGLGQGRMSDADYAGALIHLKKALRYAPEDGKALALIDECNKRIAEVENSTTMVNRLLKTAIDLYAERRFSDALSAFDEVLHLDPGNPMAVEYRNKCQVNIRGRIQRLRVEANSLAGRNDYEGAIRTLERALAIDPQERAVIADIDRYKKLLEKSKTRVEPVPKPEPPATKTQAKRPSVNRPLLERKYSQGMNAFNDGDFDRAIESLSEVWAQDPTFHNVSSLLAKAYLFVGMNRYSDQNYSEAIRLWERALAVDPKNSKAKRYLSKANEELKKLGGVNSEY